MSGYRLLYSPVDTGENPQISIIWMHGLGDHGSSFIPLVPEFDLTDCPPIRFIFPHAPERPITANNGFPLRAWFDIIESFSNTDIEDSEGVYQSQAAITTLIEMEIKRGIEPNHIFLAGFSQGCAMALYTGLCYPQKLAGIIGLSGYVPLLQDFPNDRHSANQNTPIFMAHGTQDDVVPFSRGEDSKNQLEKLGYDVTWNAYNMTHTMSLTEVQDLGDWLRNILLK